MPMILKVAALRQIEFSLLETDRQPKTAFTMPCLLSSRKSSEHATTIKRLPNVVQTRCVDNVTTSSVDWELLDASVHLFT